MKSDVFLQIAAWLQMWWFDEQLNKQVNINLHFRHI